MSAVSSVNSSPAQGLWHGGGVGGGVGDCAPPLRARPWPRRPRVAGGAHTVSGLTQRAWLGSSQEQVLGSRGDPELGTKEGGSSKDFSAWKGFVGKAY